MSSNRTRLTLSLTLLGLCLGCQKTPEIWNPSRPFKTQIVVGTASGVEFKTIELEGVKDQKTLKGDIVEFYLSPGEKNSELVGRSAVARFVQDSNGVHIPANSLSLQMVSLYYHMQSLRKLEIESFGRTYVTWPRQIGLRVNTQNAETRFNNAFYNSQLDVIFFVPYSEDQLPLPLNGGVIAHEHFHSYFSRGVLQKINQSEKKLEPLDDYVLKSLNEGLADIWGWIYTGQTDFIALSLPQFSQSRKLDTTLLFRMPKIKSNEELKLDLKFAEDECKKISVCSSEIQIITALAYLNGTVFARTLKNFLVEQKLSQKEMAQKVFLLLEKIEQLKQENSLELESALVEWSKLFDSLSVKSCEILKNSIKTKEIQDQICTSL
jgi:hypothetical protein